MSAFKFDVTVDGVGHGQSLRMYTNRELPVGSLAVITTNGTGGLTGGLCTLGIKQVELLRDMLNAHLTAEGKPNHDEVK